MAVKFRLGDRVRTQRDSDVFFEGQTGTVVATGELGDVIVRFDPPGVSQDEVEKPPLEVLPRDLMLMWNPVKEIDDILEALIRTAGDVSAEADQSGRGNYELTKALGSLEQVLSELHGIRDSMVGGS